MALSRFEKDMQIIQALDDEPNDVGGMSSTELKATFDEGGEAVKGFLNDVLIPALDTYIARTDNPHAVTKAQVGLGNCDNTTDADKPVSVAQTAAIAAAKVEAVSVAASDATTKASAAKAEAIAASDTLGAAAAAVSQHNTAESGVHDALFAGKLDKTGGTLTGLLTLNGAPTASLHAATKQYVDEVSAGVVLGQIPDGSITPEKLSGGVNTTLTTSAAHVGRTDNPHSVTPAQIGADPSGSAAAVQANLNTHTVRTDNPHGVTAAQIGAATAVEQQAMAPLLRLQTGLGNEYIWEKYTTHPDGTKAILNNYLFLQNSNPTTFTIYYADSFTVISDTNGLKFQLVNPSTLGFTTNNVVTGDPLKGKYCLVNNYTPLMYIPPEAVFTTPNGAGLQVFVSVCTKYGAPTNKKTVHSYVNSADPNAYPISDGYLYNSLGKLGNRSWVLSGSYMGTGVYGSANPNVLTFPSEPKLFIVQCATSVGDSYLPRGLTITSSYCTDFMLWTSGQKNYYIQSQGYSSQNNYIDSGQNSLSWYSVNNAQCQMNVLSMVYYYVAIGG